MTIRECGDEHNLALWLTPDAIRDAFDGHDDDPTTDMTDEQLVEVGYGVLDGIYDEYRRLLNLNIEEIK